MPITINAGSLHTAGLRADFISTYQRRYNASVARLKNCMQLGVPSDKRTEFFAYPETAPYPEIWERGDTIPEEAFDSVGYNVTNKNWGKKISWHEDDEADDQIGAIKKQLVQLGENWGTLNERVFFQILNGATDARLLPTLPTAPDGSNLFSTTDGGGGNRFGVSSGNLLTGSGVATSAAIRTDIFTALEQFGLFQDTQGEPLNNAEVIEAGVTVIFGIGNWQKIAEAFLQSRTVEGSVTPTNIIKEAGVNFTLWPTSRITTNDIHVFLNDSIVKPVFQLDRMPLRERFADETNSDVARETGNRSLYYKARRGFGLNIPHGAIKIDN